MNIIQRLYCIILLSSLSITVQAQLVPADLDAQLCTTLDSMRTVTGAKSFSAAIQFADGAVWAHADGVSSVSPDVAVSPNDAYLIGSVTKTITSACILQMAEEGLLHLDDSLYMWLDTIPHINPNITIRQLLQHTSGIYDVLSHPHQQDSLIADITRIWTAEELIARFMNPPVFTAGTSWSYSNTNYFLLDMIIKKITGNAFYTELRKRFYTPLALHSFAIPAFETLTAPVAHLWMDIDGDAVKDDANDFYMSYMALNSTAGAAGGYFATPSDCTRWMRKYMRGDVLSAASMTEARKVVVASGSQGGYYGLGMMKNQANFLGYLAYGHGGDLAYHASSWYFPEKDASITVFTNDNDKNSWALLPVVRELLRTYISYKPVAVTQVQNNAPESIQAFPNPFTNELTVALAANGYTGELEVTLNDVCGKTIARQRTPQTTGKDSSVQLGELETLPSGIYLLTVKAGDNWTKTIRVAK